MCDPSEHNNDWKELSDLQLKVLILEGEIEQLKGKCEDYVCEVLHLNSLLAQSTNIIMDNIEQIDTLMEVLKREKIEVPIWKKLNIKKLFP